MPSKKAESSYIQYKKTFTKKEQIEMITLLSADWMMDKTEVITRLVIDGLTRERNKRVEIKSYSSR